MATSRVCGLYRSFCINPIRVDLGHAKCDRPFVSSRNVNFDGLNHGSQHTDMGPQWLSRVIEKDIAAQSTTLYP